mgnify:FL=1
MKITEKEEFFNKAILDRFISPEDLFYGSLEHGKCSTWDDQCYVSGLAAAAYCMKYAWSRDTEYGVSCMDVIEAKATAIKLICGLFLLQDVTGVPGLVARGVKECETANDPTEFLAENWHYNKKLHLLWKGDISTDQLISLVMGYSVGYELIDNKKIRDGIRKRITAIADHLIANDMQILDISGSRTRHGDLRKRLGFNPLNCFIGLAVFSLSKRVTKPVFEYAGDEDEAGDLLYHKKYENYYEKLISQGYDTQAKKAQSAWWDWVVKWLGKTNHSDNAMAFIAFLSIHFSDPEAPFLKPAVQNCWKLVKSNQVPFFAYVTEKITWDFSAYDSCTIRDIIGVKDDEYFQDYPIDLHPKKMDKIYLEVRYRKWPINGHGSVPQRWLFHEPVPIQDRFLDVFDPKENSRRLSEGWDQPFKEFSPLSWIFQYWLGKFFSFI